MDYNQNKRKKQRSYGDVVVSTLVIFGENLVGAMF